jgi:hypothetical protein
MPSKVLITIGLLGAACTIPIQAQSQTEEGKLNFSMGGGLSVPLNPTANYAGVGGSFIGGGGYNIDKHNSIVGQFMWDGLPPSVSARAQLNGGSASINLYNITADYKFRSGFGNTFGYYVIAGGGWYYRHASISKSTFIATTMCVSPSGTGMDIPAATGTLIRSVLAQGPVLSAPTGALA